MSSPALYADVQKSANDLIRDNFNFDRKFKLTTKTGNGITLTTEGALKAKSSEGKLGAKFNVAFLSVDKLQTTTAGRFISEVSVKDLVPHLKLGIKIDDGIAGSGDSKGSINATYTQPHFSVYGEVDLLKGPTLSESVTFAYEGFIAGAELKYDTQLDESEPKPSITAAGAVLGYTAKDFSASLQASDFGKKLSLAVYHEVSPVTKLAVTYDLEPKSGNKNLTVAALHKIDDKNSVAGLIDSKGTVSASYIQTFSPAVKTMTSVQVDSKTFAGDSHKYGLQLILG